MNFYKFLLLSFFLLFIQISKSYSDTIQCNGKEMEKNFYNLAQCTTDEIINICRKYDEFFGLTSFSNSQYIDEKLDIKIFNDYNGGLEWGKMNNKCGFPEEIGGYNYKMYFNNFKYKDYSYISIEIAEYEVNKISSLFETFEAPLVNKYGNGREIKILSQDVLSYAENFYLSLGRNNPFEYEEEYWAEKTIYTYDNFKILLEKKISPGGTYYINIHYNKNGDVLKKMIEDFNEHISDTFDEYKTEIDKSINLL